MSESQQLAGYELPAQGGEDGAEPAAPVPYLRRVILESPYGGDVERNVRYARLCVRDSLSRGEAPIASHLLYTQPTILNDAVASEREWGIGAGLAWLVAADASVVYDDFGISVGMKYGMMMAEKSCCPIERRQLPAHILATLAD